MFVVGVGSGGEVLVDDVLVMGKWVGCYGIGAGGCGSIVGDSAGRIELRGTGDGGFGVDVGGEGWHFIWRAFRISLVLESVTGSSY